MESPAETSGPEKKEQSPKRKIKNSRRFSDEQIKSLESIFKTETKLEPRKKLQVARDLGLQPRQVAIWFQNRRARWKSKQIEQEFRVLKANYDSLYVKFDDLKKEKQSLQMQLQELHDLVKNLDDSNLANREDEFKEYPNNSPKEEEMIANYFEKTEEEISHLAASPEKWCNFSSFGGTSNWWES